jgi:hypothetical protein
MRCNAAKAIAAYELRLIGLFWPSPAIMANTPAGLDEIGQSIGWMAGLAVSKQSLSPLIYRVVTPLQH